MPEVITNTSPLQYLHQAELLELLRDLYGEVTIPDAVVEELEVGRSLGVALPDIATVPWLKTRSVANTSLLPLAADLGRGEREVLALATEIPGSLTILDDALARRYAGTLKLKMTGTLGVLLKGKQVGKVDSVHQVIDTLESLGFRLDVASRAHVLELAGEE